MNEKNNAQFCCLAIGNEIVSPLCFFSHDFYHLMHLRKWNELWCHKMMMLLLVMVVVLSFTLNFFRIIWFLFTTRYHDIYTHLINLLCISDSGNIELEYISRMVDAIIGSTHNIISIVYKCITLKSNQLDPFNYFLVMMANPYVAVIHFIHFMDWSGSQFTLKRSTHS